MTKTWKSQSSCKLGRCISAVKIWLAHAYLRPALTAQGAYVLCADVWAGVPLKDNLRGAILKSVLTRCRIGSPSAFAYAQGGIVATNSLERGMYREKAHGDKREPVHHQTARLLSAINGVTKTNINSRSFVRDGFLYRVSKAYLSIKASRRAVAANWRGAYRRR